MSEEYENIEFVNPRIAEVNQQKIINEGFTKCYCRYYSSDHSQVRSDVADLLTQKFLGHKVLTWYEIWDQEKYVSRPRIQKIFEDRLIFSIVRQSSKLHGKYLVVCAPYVEGQESKAFDIAVKSGALLKIFFGERFLIELHFDCFYSVGEKISYTQLSDSILAGPLESMIGEDFLSCDTEAAFHAKASERTLELLEIANEIKDRTLKFIE